MQKYLTSHHNGQSVAGHGGVKQLQSSEGNVLCDHIDEDIDPHHRDASKGRSGAKKHR
jgi:hypothetical protein